jgi:hypothetical protein
MAFSWEEYRLFMGGRFVTGVRGFKYKTSRTVEDIYAEGNEPVDVGFGNKTYEGEIKVLQSELNAIVLAGGGDIYALPPFTIVHSFVPKGGRIGKPVTVTMKDCYFKECEEAMEQGATFMEITLPVRVGKIIKDIQF